MQGQEIHFLSLAGGCNYQHTQCVYIRHFWGFDLNLYIFNVNLDVNVLIVRACFGAQTCIHMKANTLNDIYFFGRMLYNEFLQNVHLVPKSNNIPSFSNTTSTALKMSAQGKTITFSTILMKDSSLERKFPHLSVKASENSTSGAHHNSDQF